MLVCQFLMQVICFLVTVCWRSSDLSLWFLFLTPVWAVILPQMPTNALGLRNITPNWKRRACQIPWMLLSVITNLQSLKWWVWVPSMPPYWFKYLNIWFHNAKLYSVSCRRRIRNVIYLLSPRCLTRPHLSDSFLAWTGERRRSPWRVGACKRAEQQERAWRASSAQKRGIPVLIPLRETPKFLHSFLMGLFNDWWWHWFWLMNQNFGTNCTHLSKHEDVLVHEFQIIS